MITYINKTSELIIDKISATLKIPSEYQDAAMKHMTDLVDAGYAQDKHTGQYYKSIEVFSGATDTEKILVQGNPKHPKISFLRIEFNPSKSHASDALAVVDTMIPNGYQLLIEEGISTRMDFAVDIFKEEISDFNFWYPNIEKTSGHYNKGKTETYYLGVKSSSKQFCIYDKGAEIKSKNVGALIKKEIPPYPVTRVEARILKRIPLNNLASTPNPFSKLGVSKYGSPNPSDCQFNLFLKACSAFGAQDVLLSLPEHIRKEYRKRLSEKTPSWWNHESIWAQSPQLFENLISPPTNFSLSMFGCEGQKAIQNGYG